jgi:hypothetical protein
VRIVAAGGMKLGAGAEAVSALAGRSVLAVRSMRLPDMRGSMPSV